MTISYSKETTDRKKDPSPSYFSYFATWVAMALALEKISVRNSAFSFFFLLYPYGRRGVAHLPLGSVWLDQVGVHLMTVGAHCEGNCSSNIERYQ